MSEIKSPRIMTEKGFLHKSKGSVSAIAFLAAHREFLQTGTLSGLTAPILAKLDSKELMPTPALEEIRKVVFGHMVAKDMLAAQEMMRNPPKKGRPKSSGRLVSFDNPATGEKEYRRVGAESKAYKAFIYDGQGNIAIVQDSKGKEVELSKSFDLSSDASNWVDRRLFDGAVDWHGEVEGPAEITVTICREDSIARILRKPIGPSCHIKSKGTSGKMGWGMKVSNDVSRFSRG